MNLISLTKHDDDTFTARWSDNHPIVPLVFNAWHAADGAVICSASGFKAKPLSAEQMETAVCADQHPAYALAAMGASKRPELASRMQKAAEIVAAGAVKLLNDTAVVKTYRVANGRCDCKDFEFRAPNGWCKHRLAVRMAAAL